MPAARPPMQLDTGPADDRGPAPLQAVEAILYASQGFPGYGRQILYTDYSHGTNYALVVRNQGAGGLALQVQGSDETARLLVADAGVSVVGALGTTSNVTVGGTLTLPAGTVALPSLAVGQANSGLYSPAADRLAITVNGVRNTGFGETAGDPTIGFLGAVAVELAAAWTQTYTDLQRSIDPLVSTTPAAFSGIASGLGGSPYASVTNLNDLRSALGLVRADINDVKKNLNSLIEDFRDYGLEP